MFTFKKRNAHYKFLINNYALITFVTPQNITKLYKLQIQKIVI